MVDIIEESFNVYIHNIVHVLHLNQLHALCDSVFSRPVWTETITSFKELRFAYGVKHLQNCLLYHSVPYGWYSKWTFLAVRLRYLHPPYRLWVVTFQLVSHSADNLISWTFFNVSDSKLVRARSITTIVPLEVTICQQDVLFRSDNLHKVGENFSILTSCIQIVEYCCHIIIFSVS